MSARIRFVDWYVTLITAAGSCLFVLLAGSSELEAAAGERGFWLYAILLLLGEIFPISIPRRGGEVDEVTASTTFAFALMIGFGTPAAVVAQVFASVAADAILRKSPWKVAFNAGQYALSLGIAGMLYHGLGGTSRPDAVSLVPFAVSALTFFLLNTVITDIAVAASTSVGYRDYIVKDLAFQAYATLPLLALAPVVVAAADESLLLVPLATAPAIAVWWGTRLALENARLAGELTTSLEQQQELNRVKDDFVSVVSHELRTPLTSIQGYLKTMLQLSSSLPESQRNSFLEAADRQGDRLRRLIEQLLVVGRLETHVEPMTLAPLSFERLMSNVVDELRTRANGHAFDVRIQPELAQVMSDEGKVHQIVSNLVENALKYSPPDTRVSIRVGSAADGVVVSVLDEGPGIPLDHRERIFERFYQIDQSATRTVGGTGLGLYICRKMAESIGAELWLASSDQTGSEFALFLPERTDAGPGSEPESEPEPEGAAEGTDQSITARI
jgi:signal transduction histidine kinase